MASTAELYRRRQGTSLTTCPPPEPGCSTCGMLECTCRPRFFAGQVLNADDLNRLDAYIRAKHRLHNRQLHGWGVVNGLEVMCNPCGDGVAVGCGYALSPCGDDIVVCDAVTVDVCSLIRRCKDAEAKCGPCEPFQHPGVAGCDAAEEEWILAIRYAEKPQRGVKPLYAPAQADCGCSCGKSACSCGSSFGKSGGSMKSGCGCGAKSAAQCSCSSNGKPRGAPVQCEATVICEGFEFEVYRREPPPKPDSDNGSTIKPDSPLIARFRCCYDHLVTQAPQTPGPFSPAAVAANPSAWYLWACRFQAHLLRHYQLASGYNCALLAQLGALVITLPGANGAGVPALVQAIQLLLLVALDGLFACLCSALLPPCPPPTVETRVPLASLHVANHPCRVIRVCNWAVERKFATTFPALQYWLSMLPYGAGLRQLLQTLCCFDVTGLFRDTDAPGVAGVAGAVPVAAAAAAGGAGNAGGAGGAGAAGGAAGPGGAAGAGAGPGANGGFDRFHQQAILRLNPTLGNVAPLQDASMLLADVLVSAAPLEPELLMNTLFASNAQTDKLPPVQGGNLAQFLLLNQLAKPMAQGALGTFAGLGIPRGRGGIDDRGAPAPGTRAAPGQPAPRAAGEDAEAMASMREEMARLQATVERHAGEIEQLRAKPAGPRPKKGNR